MSVCLEHPFLHHKPTRGRDSHTSHLVVGQQSRLRPATARMHPNYDQHRLANNQVANIKLVPQESHPSRRPQVTSLSNHNKLAPMLTRSLATIPSRTGGHTDNIPTPPNKCQSGPVSNTRMPLPSFSWANGAEVWNCMLEKDASYSKLRSDKMLDRHRSLVDSYRTILLDWLSEVSHECKFHRETYHLALDFIDRYLTAQSNVGKLQLQLIGTTCLFIAAKFEEIRPPTVNELAELTDGGCKPEDIIESEVNILAAINWNITPMTPNSWLNTYMQILLNLDKQLESGQDIDNNSDDNVSGADENSQSRDIFSPLAKVKDDSFILPSNSGILKCNHKRIASVIDLALLHIQSLRFSNSILTASALYHFTDDITVRQCTGYQYKELADCILWLRPFVETIKEIREPVFLASCRGDANSTQMHSHIATAKLLDRVIQKMNIETVVLSPTGHLKRKACDLTDDEPDSGIDSVILSPSKPTTLLTPPRSARKSRRVK